MTEPPGAAIALAVLVFGPVLAGLAIFVSGRRALVADAVTALLVVAVAAALVVLSLLVRDQGGVAMAMGGHTLPLAIPLRLDGLSLTMLWLTALVSAAVAAYTSAWLRTIDPPSGLEYRVLSLFAWAGLNALLLSSDLFNLYVTLEVITLAAVPMVVLTRGPAAIDAAIRYLLFALLGSMLFLLGVALIYAKTGLLALDSLAARDGGGSARLTALAVMTTGLAMKAALFPLHGWLPKAHATAPGPASAVLSALVVPAAAYLLLRIWLGPLASSWTPAMAQLLGALGIAALVYGSVQALRQPRLKMVIAYSTVAQLGYLLLLIPLASVAAWQGAAYYALTHGLAKAAMFLAAANLALVLGGDSLDRLDGADRTAPVSVLVLAIAGMSLAGLPPAGGFVAKWWLIEAALGQGQWWWAAAIAAGGLLSAAYVVRILTVCLDHRNLAAGANGAVDSPVLSPAMTFPPMALALASLALGLAGSALAPFIRVGAP